MWDLATSIKLKYGGMEFNNNEVCPTVIFLISVVCCILFLCLVVYLQSTNVAGIVIKFVLNSLIFMIDLN